MLYKRERLEILKSDFKDWGEVKPDKEEGVPNPPMFKAPIGGEKTMLTKDFNSVVIKSDILDILDSRKSHRKYSEESIEIDELSFLLYYTQGVKRVTSSHNFRTVPSGGIRHPFETYLAVHNVGNLKKGIYHYLPEEHAIELVFEDKDLKEHMNTAASGQIYAANCAVTFIWTVVPYRAEWRYHMSSYKVMLQDSGHMCQNLYIACEAINCGTVAIGYYNQEWFDEYLKLDPEEEFVVYMAPVGRQR